MTKAQQGWGRVCAVVLATGWLGCGGEDETSASAQVESWSRPEARASEGGNQPPVIASVALDPEPAVAGRRLSSSVEASDPDQDKLKLQYVWSIDGRRIDATSSAIDLPDDLVRGARITLAVTATDTASASSEAEASVSVGNRPPKMQEIGIRVVPGEGEDLGDWVADPLASDPDGDDVSYRYEWRLGERVVGDGDRLGRAGWRRGDALRLVVWPSDDEVEGDSLESAPFEIGNSPPAIVSRPPGLDSSGRFVYAIEAQDPDGDRGLRYSLVKGPEAMAVDPFSGEVVWQATESDAGEHEITVEVEDRKGGSTRQTFFVAVEVEESTGPASLD